MTSLKPSAAYPSANPDLSHRLTVVENKLKETENQSVSQQGSGTLHYHIAKLNWLNQSLKYNEHVQNHKYVVLMNALVFCFVFNCVVDEMGWFHIEWRALAPWGDSR